MYFTGFADEAANDIDGQIGATKELGWSCIESRGVNGGNIHDISDEEFDIVYGRLQEAEVKVNCFGSAIANWERQSMSRSIRLSRRRCEPSPGCGNSEPNWFEL